MPTHSLTPGHHHDAPGPVARGTRLPHARREGRWTRNVPVVGGIVLGLYATYLASQNGFSTLGYWMMGLAVAVVSMGLGYVLIRERGRMITEVRAAAFGTLFGCSMGFLHSLGGGTVLRASQIGLLAGLGMGLASYYVFYWHEH
ncbi:hypothetical protein AF335_23160 [Streptomyces eurocidicus]|uniref:Uncharacterized protein n=1 Tax=Streptomyces eurocidicus TaxID=66423 RepID=A0A2N8NSJ5_STREU|nr:hypothetical protein [Streptomyces eurocidicus]MBB5119994.1 hypothetical protein [Streptomyces eurocidicus]MBF6051819.1 hypothetical protein [Streptomyces eurocidicus]PNE31740.1 hypothetical protein AF335_23160 [Streptomyces eurocidicus]